MVRKIHLHFCALGGFQRVEGKLHPAQQVVLTVNEQDDAILLR